MPDKKPNIEFKIRIVIEPDEDVFHAYCPALKGLHTCGDTEEQAIDNVKDAAIAYLRSLIKHGDPIPVGIVADEEEDEMSFPPEQRITHHTRDLVVAGA